MDNIFGWKSFKEGLGKSSSLITIFTGLSKTFDNLNYDLLISKLEAYDFSGEPLS